MSALVDVGVGAGCFFGGTFGNGSSPVFSHAGLGFAIVHAVEIGVVRSAVSMLGANGEPAYGGGTEGFHAGGPSCFAHLSWCVDDEGAGAAAAIMRDDDCTAGASAAATVAAALAIAWPTALGTDGVGGGAPAAGFEALPRPLIFLPFPLTLPLPSLFLPPRCLGGRGFGIQGTAEPWCQRSKDLAKLRRRLSRLCHDGSFILKNEKET